MGKLGISNVCYPSASTRLPMLAMSRCLRLFLLFLCGLAGAIALTFSPVQAQQVTQATVVEILDSDQVYIQNRKAETNSQVQRGEQVRTGSARVGLRLNNNAGIRLGHNSSLILGDRCVQINRGQVLIGGPARGCIGSVVAVTRGTLYLMEQNEHNLGRVTVLEGAISISNPDDPSRPPLIVRERESVTIIPQGILGAIEKLSVQQFDNLVQQLDNLLQDFRVPIPGLDAFNALLQRLGLAPASPDKPIPGLW
jgi:hypothetical protein